MIDLDVGKLILLALIALVVLGPEKLPVAARTVGAIVRRMRSGWNNVRAEVERELQVAEITRAAREVSQQVASSQAGLDAAVGKLRAQLDGGALNTPVQPTQVLEKRSSAASSRFPSALGSSIAPASERSGQANTAEDVQHDIT